MITTRPDIVPGGRYSQADAARALGVHRNTIRRWTYDGVLKMRMRRAPSTRPFYLGSDLLALWGDEIRIGKAGKPRGTRHAEA